MPIENRDLEPGTKLVARYKGKDHVCKVVQTDDGLRYRLGDGSEHRSPSSAGKAVMGGVACNGWRFWSMEGTEPKPKAAKKPAKAAGGARTAKKGAARPKGGKKAKKSKPKGAARRMRASDVPSYGCQACGATFGSQKAAVDHALTHTS
jgi:hypothetical protein